MRLQHKLAFYNTLTKIAIIAVLGVITLVFVDRISFNHLQQRLIDKRNKLIDNLSDHEIENLFARQRSFTDYNILKEEYIILTGPETRDPGKPAAFTQETRIIDGNEEEYLILTDTFMYNGQIFGLEIGETILVVRQIEHTILFFTLLMLVISVALTMVADFAFTRVILEPLYRIIDQKINKVNDPIHFDYTPTPTTTDDFRLLDSSINSLMQKINVQMATEKQFITNVSHELLTPISILRTRLENMLNDNTLQHESQTRLVASLRTLSRLKAIVNSLLLISKVENLQFSKTDKVAVTTLIADIQEELEDRMLEKNITLQNSLTGEVEIIGNQTLLHTLFMNIVNNAIKYNKPNGHIKITDELRNGGYRLMVTDNGTGMNAEQISNAFNRFDKSPAADTDSHGLGLAIAKSIASFHGAHISIASAPGEGTTVTVEFGKL